MLQAEIGWLREQMALLKDERDHLRRWLDEEAEERWRASRCAGRYSLVILQGSG